MRKANLNIVIILCDLPIIVRNQLRVLQIHLNIILVIKILVQSFHWWSRCRRPLSGLVSWHFIYYVKFTAVWKALMAHAKLILNIPLMVLDNLLHFAAIVRANGLLWILLKSIKVILHIIEIIILFAFTIAAHKISARSDFLVHRSWIE